MTVNIAPLRISASQIETWRLCHRKWWLEKVAKAKTRDKGYFDFGTVLHAVAERWLLADDRGVDPKTGHPVELYPPGWEIAEDTKVAIPLAEQALIKKLIAAAVDEGVLRRQPGRKIEEQFERHMDTIDGVPVIMAGVIDVLLPDGIEDHKTTKDWRYAKSAEQLQSNPQVLIYAAELLRRWCDERGNEVYEGELPERISVRHNVFGKDPEKPRVRATSAWVTPEQIEAEWQRCLADARQMLNVRKAKDWQDIAGPEPETNGCRAFGGCDFQRLCSGEKTLDEMNNLNSSLTEGRLLAELQRSPERNPAMVDTLTALMARRAAATGGAPTAPAKPAPDMNSGTAPAAPAPAAAAPPPTAPAGERQRAPWYVEGCTACKDNKVLGFSTKGTPCRICNNVRAKAGQETADAYEITPAAEGGQVTWKRRDGAGAAASAPAAPAAPAKVDKPAPPAEPAPAAAAPPPAAAPAPVAAAATPPTSAPEVAPESDEAIPEGEAPAAAARGRGRPKAGFTLLVNCRPGKGFSGRTLYLSEILAAHIKVVEQHPRFGGSAEAPKNFWSLNAFDRRDALVQQAPAIAEALGTSVLVVDTDLLEARGLVDALRGFPCREVVGLGR